LVVANDGNPWCWLNDEMIRAVTCFPRPSALRLRGERFGGWNFTENVHCLKVQIGDTARENAPQFLLHFRMLPFMADKHLLNCAKLDMHCRDWLCVAPTDKT
jgi:hypothetical protein